MFLFKRNQADDGYENIDVKMYHDTYFNGKAEHTLVDVRTPAEFASGRVPGAVLIPLDEILVRMEEIARDKPVIVICATGNRSRNASSALVKAGFTDVYNFKGGTMTWMMHRHPLER